MIRVFHNAGNRFNAGIFFSAEFFVVGIFFGAVFFRRIFFSDGFTPEKSLRGKIPPGRPPAEVGRSAVRIQRRELKIFTDGDESLEIIGNIEKIYR